MAKSNKNELINWELVATNPSDKTWNWKDLFCYWGVNIQSIIGFSLIASLYLIYQLNTTVVFLGSVLGSLLVWFFCNLIGKPSQVHGVPFIVLLRTSLGFKGAKYFGALRFLVGIFMFGIQTYFLSKAFSYLIRILFFSINDELLNKDIFLIFLSGLNIIDWVSILIAIILQTYFLDMELYIVKNYKAFDINSLLWFNIIFFNCFLSDVKLTLNVFLDSLNFKGFLSSQNIIPLFTVAGTVFAYFSIVILSFGDFSKYVQTEKELIKGNLSILINLVIFSFFAVFITIGSDIFLKDDANSIVKILTNPTDIIGKFNNIQLTVIALLFIILASASTNLVANFIPCQFTLINFLPKKLNLQSSSYVISIIGLLIGILWLPLFSQIGILAFVDTFGSFFGPLFGLMITDYYLVKNKELVSKDIYSIEKNSTYYYSNGWHLKAIYCLIIGFIFAASTIWNYNLMYLQSFSWIIGAFITSLTYYLLAKNNMKALVYTGTQELVYREEQNPIEVDGESILKVHASGICGSDMHAYHGHDERRIPPLILGHEVSGEVQNGKYKGKDVVLNPLITCGKCEYCTSGREHLCPERMILGMSKPIERQGVFAEYVSTPDKNIYEIPDGLDKNDAPIAEPTAVSLHAVLIGEQSLKKPLSECRTLIQGGGAIGLLCGLILSKIKGNTNITLSDPNKLRLDECSKYLDAKFVAPNHKEIQSNSFDIVFDTVGLEISRQQAIEVVKPGGSIIHIGLTQPAGTFNFRKMTLQEVTVIGTYCYTNRDFEQTLSILSKKEIGPLNWIEFRDLKNGGDAFKQIHDGTCVAPKIILLP